MRGLPTPDRFVTAMILALAILSAAAAPSAPAVQDESAAAAGAEASEPDDPPSEVPPEETPPLPDPEPPPEPAPAEGGPESDGPSPVPVEPTNSASGAEPAPDPAGGTADAFDDPFPFPEGLRGHVEFWTSVFGVYGRGKVLLHDAEFPALVYEVFDLPGEAGGTYTKAQEAYVRSRREALERRVQHLEWMIELAAPLTADEKALALQITTHAGTDAVRGAAKRIRSQRGVRERFLRGLEISGRYDAAFRKAFRDAGLPEDLALLPHVESSYQTAARSSAGAVGVWQFTRGAGRVFLNMTAALDERMDPVASARGAARYLGRAHEMLGDWALAVTSYNHGMGGMRGARDRFGTDFDRIVREYDGRSFGFASKNFYAEFLAARAIVRDLAAFFPEGIRFEPPLAVDEIVLPVDSAPARIAQKYAVSLGELVSLNPGWTQKAVRHGRAIPAGASVWLPGGTLERIAASRRPARERRPAEPAAPARAADPSPSEPPGEAEAAGIEHHIVRRGETLASLAETYRTSIDALRGINGIPKNRSTIREGQRIRVRAATPPPRDGLSAAIADFVVHVVRKGETLVKIAATHRVTLADLLSANALGVGSVIHPGQTIKVPILR